MYPRKGAGDKEDEIRVSIGIGRKTLKPGAIPSIFHFKNPSKIKPRVVI